MPSPDIIYSSERERLRALYDLAVDLSALRSRESVYAAALKQCLHLTGSQFGFIGMNTEDFAAMDVAAIEGFHPGADFYAHFHMIPLRPNVFARAVLENRPIRSVDAMLDPVSVGQPAHHPPVHAFLGVPLRILGEPIGMIGVANRPSPYNEEHEQLLMTYAAIVAIAIRNAQLYEQLTEANRELQRQIAERNQALQMTQDVLTNSATQIQTLMMETVDALSREQTRVDSAELGKDEINILRLLAQGASNATVAETLHVSETTLKRKLRSIQSKLGTTTRTQAVAEAVRRGWV